MPMVMDVQVAQNGRMVLPKPVRDALGMADGGTVLLSVEGDEVKLTSIRHSIKRAQDLYQQYATINVSVDDFLKERRAETAKKEPV